MHSLSINIILILIACFLPYFYNLIIRYAAVDQSTSAREYVSNSSRHQRLAQRANAVRQDSFEGLPLFIAAILVADYLVLSDWVVFILGVGYLIFRMAYGICYLMGWSPLSRTLWILATACPVLMLLLSMQFF